MVKSTNTKWFTLVELIIVITILAILATIAFISFQGYSKDARDASKQSEIANIVKIIAADSAKNEVNPMAYIKSPVSGVDVAGVQGLSSATSSTGKLNTEVIGLNNSKYADQYEVAVYTWTLNVYQIRAKMENVQDNWEYFVSGTYSPRKSAVAWTVNGGSWITLTSWIGLVKVGDSLWSADLTVTKVSSDLTQLTVNNNNWFTSFTYNEPASLFGN